MLSPASIHTAETESDTEGEQDDAAAEADAATDAGAGGAAAYDPAKKPAKSILKANSAAPDRNGEDVAPADDSNKRQWRQQSEKVREMMRRARATKGGAAPGATKSGIDLSKMQFVQKKAT